MVHDFAKAHLLVYQSKLTDAWHRSKALSCFPPKQSVLQVTAPLSVQVGHVRQSNSKRAASNA